MELSLLEIMLLFIRAGYPDAVAHPGERSMASGDILVRDGSGAVQVVVAPWDWSWMCEPRLGADGKPLQTPSAAEQVRGLITRTYASKGDLLTGPAPTLVVVRPFFCGGEPPRAFDDATIGEGLSHCVETDDETGEVVCRIGRTTGGAQDRDRTAAKDVFGDSTAAGLFSAVCLYRPPYPSPEDACFRLKENPGATRHHTSEMFGRLAAAHQAAVVEEGLD